MGKKKLEALKEIRDCVKRNERITNKRVESIASRYNLETMEVKCLVIRLRREVSNIKSVGCDIAKEKKIINSAFSAVQKDLQPL